MILCDSQSFVESDTDSCCWALAGAVQFHTNCTMEGSHSSVDNATLQFQHTICSDDGKGPFIWSSPKGLSQIDIGKKIFCNRSLNMKNIVAVGFDMDYTLAQYMPETFESLAYEGTIRKLVYDLGYPSEACLQLSIFFHLYSSKNIRKNKMYQYYEKKMNNEKGKIFRS